jgi:adenylate cyclase
MAERPAACTIDDIVEWLLDPARTTDDSLLLFDEFCWRVVASGVPAARVIFSVRTLHPQLVGIGYRWWRSSGVSEESEVPHATLDSAAFKDSPIRRVFETGETLRRRLDIADAPMDFPILAELKAEGMTDYLVMPIGHRAGPSTWTSWSSDKPGGFTEGDLRAIERLSNVFSLRLDIHAARRIAANLLDAYVGKLSGRRVLKGEIKRGSGETIRAVIWTSDLRAFTALSDRTPGARVIELLNAYFERAAAAIQTEGGEILKFIGDGVLAIFPIATEAEAGDAAARALRAARATLEAIDAFNASPAMAKETKLRMAVALHVGDVIHGNIGAPDRLDFTVIGPAVNLVGRLEALSKPLQRRILVSEDFARAHGGRLLSLGAHPLRGLSEPQEVHTPDDDIARVR